MVIAQRRLRATGALSSGSVAGAFARSQELFDAELAWLSGARRLAGSRIQSLRSALAGQRPRAVAALCQDHLDLRACREQRLDRVVGADGVRRSSVEDGA